MRTITSVVFILLLSNLSVGQSGDWTESKAGKLEGEALKTWHMKGVKEVKAYGVASDRVFSELIGDKKPKKKIVVAVIDSGVDTEHEDLNDQLWVNEDEIPDNGIDDDNNGFIDDIHGWNFLVDDQGENMVCANLEATRVLRLSKELQEKGEPYPAWLSQEVLQRAAEIFNKNTEELNGFYQLVGVYRKMDSVVVSILKDTNYSYADVQTIESTDKMASDAKQIFSVFEKLGISQAEMDELDDMVTKYTDYWLNLDYQPRKNFTADRSSYGNNQVGGKHTGHGTHVAGIIAANAYNGKGAEGIASDIAEIMVLKVIPDGDENDVDVANGIRYAVDNGANIINMSFGKGLSPSQESVNKALEYAAQKGVLVVHAAGNDRDDSDEVDNYPNDLTLSETGQSNYLCIGAIGPRKNKKMVAYFSNYGEAAVDLFAPGESIYSTLPGNEYDYRSGTSMAAPVVSGVAALVWAYHPELTSSQLRSLLIESGVDLSKKKVVQPGTKKDKIRFSGLSNSGKVVNAFEAFSKASSL